MSLIQQSTQCLILIIDGQPFSVIWHINNLEMNVRLNFFHLFQSIDLDHQQFFLRQ